MKHENTPKDTVRYFPPSRTVYYSYVLLVLILIAFVIYFLSLGNWTFVLTVPFYPFILGYHYMRFRVYPDGLEVRRSVKYLLPRTLFIPFDAIEQVERVERSSGRLRHLRIIFHRNSHRDFLHIPASSVNDIEGLYRSLTSERS